MGIDVDGAMGCAMQPHAFETEVEGVGNAACGKHHLAGAKGRVLITVPSSVEPAGAANLVRSHALTVGFHTVEQVAIDAFCLHCYQLYQ